MLKSNLVFISEKRNNKFLQSSISFSNSFDNEYSTLKDNLLLLLYGFFWLSELVFWIKFKNSLNERQQSLSISYCNIKKFTSVSLTNIHFEFKKFIISYKSILFLLQLSKDLNIWKGS